MRFALLLVLVLPLCAQPKFEVASIKPAAQPTALTAGLHTHGDRLDIGFWSITQLAMKAYGVEGFQVRGPAWIEDTRFDISATMPAGAKPSHVPEMLRALLEERFALKIHRETREMQGFAMVVAKDGIKMEPAGAFEMPEGQTVLDLLGGDYTSAFGVALSGGARNALRMQFTKMPMAALAHFTASYLRLPVTDATNLNGAYRGQLIFTLSEGGPPDADERPLRDAITDLGLRLESRKVPVEVIVVDSASRAPTEN